MRKLLREPLVHFILIGIALFVGHHFWAKWVARQDYIIEVTPQEIEHQLFLFADQFKRQPTKEDRLGLLLGYIEEEILVREALKNGLDNDTVVRRALAQKMRVKLTENTPPPLPDDAALETWFEQNRDRFNSPPKRALTHVYFSPAEHEDVEEAAGLALTEITNENWRSFGNPFIESNPVTLTDQTGLTNRFGPSFAKSVFELPGDNQWHGPINSAFGMHLVRIDEKRDKNSPVFNDVKPQVIKAWQNDALRSENAQRLEDLIEQYTPVFTE